MSDTLTADLETGAGTSAIPSSSPTPTESPSMDSLMDAALEMDTSDELSTAPVEQAPVKGVDRGDGRDAHGKFATKAEQDAADAAAKATTTAPPAKADTTVQDAPKPGGATKAPFRYRSMGATHDVPDAVVDADGNVSIPAARSGELREAFNALQLVRGEYAPTIERYKADISQLTAKLAEATESRGAEETKAQSLVTALTAAFSEPDDEKALGMLYQLRQSYPGLLANAERDHWKAQAERRTTAPAPTAPAATAPASPTMPTLEAARATVSEHVEHLKISHEFRGLTEGDWKQLAERYDATPMAFLRLATAVDAKQYPGLAEGTVVFDADALVADVQAHATTTTKQRETAAGQVQLATANARRTTATVTAPPTSSGTQAPPKSPRRFTSKEEYEAWKQSDELD